MQLRRRWLEVLGRPGAGRAGGGPSRPRARARACSGSRPSAPHRVSSPLPCAFTNPGGRPACAFPDFANAGFDKEELAALKKSLARELARCGGRGGHTKCTPAPVAFAGMWLAVLAVRSRLA
jgi:hypothetical protein